MANPERTTTIHETAAAAIAEARQIEAVVGQLFSSLLGPEPDEDQARAGISTDNISDQVHELAVTLQRCRQRLFTLNSHVRPPKPASMASGGGGSALTPFQCVEELS